MVAFRGYAWENGVGVAGEQKQRNGGSFPGRMKEGDKGVGGES